MRGQDGGERRRFLPIIRAAAQEIAVDQTLDVRMKVRLRLLDDEEGVVTLAIRHEPIEFQAFERQEDQVGGPKAGIGNAARTIVDQQTQAAQQRVDPRRREAERQRHRMLLAGNRDQPLADPLGGCDNFVMTDQLGLRLVDLLLDLRARLLVERARQFLDQRPQRRVVPARQVLLGIAQRHLYIERQHPPQRRPDRHLRIVAAEDDVLIVGQTHRIPSEIGLRLKTISETRDHRRPRVDHAVVEVRH